MASHSLLDDNVPLRYNPTISQKFKKWLSTVRPNDEIPLAFKACLISLGECPVIDVSLKLLVKYPGYAATSYRQYGRVVLLLRFHEDIATQLKEEELLRFWEDCLETGNLHHVPFNETFLPRMSEMVEKIYDFTSSMVPINKVLIKASHQIIVARNKGDVDTLNMFRNLTSGKMRDCLSEYLDYGILNVISFATDQDRLLALKDKICYSSQDIQKLCRSIETIEDYKAYIDKIHDLDEQALKLYYPDVEVVDSFPEYKDYHPSEIYMFISDGKLYRIPNEFIFSKIRSGEPIEYKSCPKIAVNERYFLSELVPFSQLTHMVKFLRELLRKKEEDLLKMYKIILSS